MIFTCSKHDMQKAISTAIKACGVRSLGGHVCGDQHVFHCCVYGSSDQATCCGIGIGNSVRHRAAIAQYKIGDHRTVSHAKQPCVQHCLGRKIDNKIVDHMSVSVEKAAEGVRCAKREFGNTVLALFAHLKINVSNG